MEKLIFAVLAATLFLTVGCGTEEGKSADVGVTLKASSAASLLDVSDEFVTPETLQFRPVAVRIGTSNNGGYMIWASKTCAGEKGKIKIDDKEYEYFSEHVCIPSEDNEWIDLLAGDTAVNEKFNSQTWPIPPGDYTHVSIIMCAKGGVNAKIGEGIGTIRYKTDLMPEDATQQICNPFGGVAETPITVTEGGSIRVQVEYDANKLVKQGVFDPLWEKNDAADSGDSFYVCDENNLCEGIVSPQFGVDALTPSLAP